MIMVVVVIAMMMMMIMVMMIDDDGDDDGYPMAGDYLPAICGQREAPALKLIAIHFAEIQNWGRCQ